MTKPLGEQTMDHTEMDADQKRIGTPVPFAECVLGVPFAEWVEVPTGPISVIANDAQNIGTAKYKGFAFFGWNQAYKHTLRDSTIEQRKKIHDAFLAAGLSLDGESDSHWKIIKSNH